MEEMERIKVYTNNITFPATKAAGAAIITGDVIYDFEGGAYGPLEVVLRALDDSKITDNLVIKLYVSYDGGATWLLSKSWTDLANGAGDPIAVLKDDILAFAPRIKLVADFDGTGALASGHGCGVDLKIREDYVDMRRYTSTVSAPTTMGNSSTITGGVVYVPNTINNIRRISIASVCLDRSKVTDNLTWKVQSSYDGTTWFDAIAAQTDITNGAGTSFTEVAVSSKLGKYVKVIYITDGTGALAADHGVSHTVILMY